MKAINKGCAMVKIDCEKLLHRYKRAVISQNEIHKLESKCYELMIIVE